MSDNNACLRIINIICIGEFSYLRRVNTVDDLLGNIRKSHRDFCYPFSGENGSLDDFSGENYPILLLLFIAEPDRGKP